jgi:hypothetical protein
MENKMTQALYAHMNNKERKKERKKQRKTERKKERKKEKKLVYSMHCFVLCL